MAKDLTTTSEERRPQIPEKVHAEERRSGCRVERGNLIFRSRTIEYFEDALVSRLREVDQVVSPWLGNLRFHANLCEQTIVGRTPLRLETGLISLPLNVTSEEKEGIRFTEYF
jgi:hypothetical protein